MSTKRKTYSAEFKAKVVLEVLEAEQTITEIASKYELLPASVKNWKKMFLENMSLAFLSSQSYSFGDVYCSRSQIARLWEKLAFLGNETLVSQKYY